MTINLTPKERIWLEASISSLSGTREKLAPFKSVLRQLETTDEYRNLYMSTNPVTRATVWSKESDSEASVSPINLDKKEMERIKELFNTMEYVNPWAMFVADGIEEKITDAVLAERL